MYIFFFTKEFIRNNISLMVVGCCYYFYIFDDVKIRVNYLIIVHGTIDGHTALQIGNSDAPQIHHRYIPDPFKNYIKKCSLLPLFR